MQEPSLSLSEAARRLGLDVSALRTAIERGSREGWLTLTDPLDRIEHELIPRALDNLKAFLDEGDKRVTVEVAKGTLFPVYQASRGVVTETPLLLALKVEMPDTPRPVTGQIVGVGRLPDGSTD